MAFGQEFASRMSICQYADGHWGEVRLTAVEPLPLHPSAHVLHYSSTCFEGMKAYLWQDGSVRLFRPDRNIERMQRSAQALCLPVPDASLLSGMIHSAVDAVRNEIPEEPGSLYIRPTLIGTDSNIGGAGKPTDEAILFVLLSPVGDYFTGGIRPLKLLLDTENMRSTPRFGQVKTGGNYAAALGSVVDARARYGADQVLFCPGGDVQETGAANFLLIHNNRVITKKLDGAVLAGVTRDSVLTLAAEMDMTIEETDYTVDELLKWLPDSEAMLTGTAAVISPVGSVILDGNEHPVGNGEVGEVTLKLRDALTDLQRGNQHDTHQWIETVRSETANA